MDIYAKWDNRLKGVCLHTATEKLYPQDFSNCVCLDAFLLYLQTGFLSTQLAHDISVHYSTYMHIECVQDCRYANAAKCSRSCRTLHYQQHVCRSDFQRQAI